MSLASNTFSVADQTSYYVTRPSGNLWLWWALATIVSHLLGVLPIFFPTMSPVLAMVLVTFTIASALLYTILTTWVLNSFLCNFQWKQWITLTIAGRFIGYLFTSVFIFASFRITSAFIFASFPTINKSPADVHTIILISDLIGAAVTPLISGLILSFAQWRVLGRYTAGRGQGIWLAMNTVLPFLAGLLIRFFDEVFSDNRYIHVTADIAVATLIALAIGYTLMRLLRAYAPAAN